MLSNLKLLLLILKVRTNSVKMPRTRAGAGEKWREMPGVVQNIRFPKLSDHSSPVLYSSFLLFCPLLVTLICTA